MRCSKNEGVQVYGYCMALSHFINHLKASQPIMNFGMLTLFIAKDCCHLQWYLHLWRQLRRQRRRQLLCKHIHAFLKNSTFYKHILRNHFLNEMIFCFYLKLFLCNNAYTPREWIKRLTSDFLCTPVPYGRGWGTGVHRIKLLLRFFGKELVNKTDLITTSFFKLKNERRKTYEKLSKNRNSRENKDTIIRGRESNIQH